MERLKNFLENVFLWRSLEKFLWRTFIYLFFFFWRSPEKFLWRPFFWRALALVSLVLGLGLEHSCPWPRECLSSERLSLALALASDFFCVLGIGLEPCALDSTSASYCPFNCWTSSREAVNTNFYSIWFDPTGNRTRVYRFSSRPSIHLTTNRFSKLFRATL